MERDPGRPIIEWGVASRTLPGERESGDSYLVKLLPGRALVSVVDGLGHGEGAAVAARAAVAALAAGEGLRLEDLVVSCHERLARTRGVAMSIALLDSREGTMTWLGVGNVQGALVPAATGVGRRPVALLTGGGVVGYKLPPLRVSALPIAPGDVLVLATDGVRAEFARGLAPSERPEEMARAALARYARGNDDALVLVVRYLEWTA